MYTTCVIAEYSAADCRDRFFQRIINVLPLAALGITKVDGFRVNNRLVAISAQVEVFDVLFTKAMSSSPAALANISFRSSFSFCFRRTSEILFSMFSSFPL